MSTGTRQGMRLSRGLTFRLRAPARRVRTTRPSHLKHGPPLPCQSTSRPACLSRAPARCVTRTSERSVCCCGGSATDSAVVYCSRVCVLSSPLLAGVGTFLSVSTGTRQGMCLSRGLTFPSRAPAQRVQTTRPSRSSHALPLPCQSTSRLACLLRGAARLATRTSECRLGCASVACW